MLFRSNLPGPNVIRDVESGNSVLRTHVWYDDPKRSDYNHDWLNDQHVIAVLEFCISGPCLQNGRHLELWRVRIRRDYWGRKTTDVLPFEYSGDCPGTRFH